MRLAIATSIVLTLAVPTISGQSAALPEAAFPQRRGGAVLENLGMVGDPRGYAGDYLIFGRSESSDGAQDFNGDGDIQDKVLHVLQRSTGALANLGIATEPFAWYPILDESGKLGAEKVPESAQHVDLNGDGDLLDQVIFSIDPAAGTATNTGLAAGEVPSFGGLAPSPPATDGEYVSFLVGEGPQGQSDLNGDGDALDTIFFSYDPATGIATNSMLAGSWLAPLGHGIAGVHLEESDYGTDLNGDGDQADVVGGFVDAKSSTGLSFGLAGGYRAFAKETGFAIFTVSEASQGGTDLNGDGDALDSVVHAVDAAALQVVNLKLAMKEDGVAIRITHEAAVFMVPEADHFGQDWNGNGDASDFVAFTYHHPSGLIWNTGLAGYARGGGVPGSKLLVQAMEGWGHIDLNGDGDSLDGVTVVVDAQTAQAFNPMLATIDAWLEGGFLHLRVDEHSQGGLDANGDGDTLDYVMALTSLATGQTWHAGVSTTTYTGQVGSSATWLVLEEEEGQQDLTGDGDHQDLVAHVMSPGAAKPQNLGVACGTWDSDVSTSSGETILRVREAPLDLNGDGDTLDLVLHALRP